MMSASGMASPAWITAGWTMLHFLWAGSVLAALAAVGRWMLRQTHPNIRYLYALASLAVLAITPGVIAWTVARGLSEVEPSHLLARSPSLETASTGPARIARLSQEDGSPPLATEPGAQAVARETPVLGPIGFVRRLDPVAALLPFVWLVGSPLTFAYLAAGLVGAEWFRRRSFAASELAPTCRSLADALGIARRVAVGVCDRIGAPLLLGVLRPVILLPPAALTGWSPEQVEMALLHELAHVRRWDNAINLVQRAIESALFFHPAIWWVSGWARQEREHCCDRIVVQHTGGALAYAETLFALAETSGFKTTLGVSMARSPLVARIRRVLSPEDRSMKSSKIEVLLAAVLLFLPVILLGPIAQQTTHGTTPPAQGPADQPVPGETKAKAELPKDKMLERDATFRQLRKDRGRAVRMRRRDPDAPVWKPGPVPETIPVKLSGHAKNEEGRPVPGARILVYSLQLVRTDRGVQPARLLGEATTDAEGSYQLEVARVPVVATNFDGSPLGPEMTPYAPLIVCGTARDLGLAWSRWRSIYALAEPNPDDVQERLPLGSPVELNLTFPKARTLKGKVVDENGNPVTGARLRVMGAELLDDAGQETNNGLTSANVIEALPGSIGQAVVDAQGRFRIEGLPDRACLWLFVYHPVMDNTNMALYAATIDGPDPVHEQLPPDAFNGRGRHTAKAGEITITFPKLRRIQVSLVGDDTSKPVPNVGVHTLGDSNIATGTVSGGKTDAAGKVLLGLPLGQYRGLYADPPIETRYIRTYQGPLVVEKGDKEQLYNFRLKAGCDLRFQAIEADSAKPVAEAFFWMVPEDEPEKRQTFEVSTFAGGSPWTDAKGELRAVLAPVPGKRYRFQFAGIHEPNMPPAIRPEFANKLGYEAEPAASEPIELAAGKQIRLRFVLRRAAAPGGK